MAHYRLFHRCGVEAGQLSRRLVLPEHPVLSRQVRGTTPTDLSPFNLANRKEGTQFAKLEAPSATFASVLEVHVLATAIRFGAAVQRQLGRFH
jgi:hypothetical protein